MPKRTYPWLLAPAAAETIPSLSPSQHLDIPVAKIPRLLVPLSANPEDYVTKTATSDAEEAVRPADADAYPKTGMQLNQQRNHKSYNECRRALAAVAPMAPVPTNMQLPNISPTTGFTGTSLVDQINVQQTLYGVNGYTSTAVRDPSQTTIPRSNAWSPWGSTWHPNVAHATDMTDLLCMRIIEQGINLEAHQRVYKWTAGAVARGLGQMTSPCWNGWRPHWSNTYHPTVTQASGQTAIEHGSILETPQDVKNWDTLLTLDPRQATTSPCWNRLHTAMDKPVVDRTIEGAGRLTAEEADIERKTDRKGRWTPDEDSELLRAVEKFSVTRWKTIAALIPGRTRKQCWNRWQYALDPSIVRMTERTGKWLTEEDKNLVAAVQKYNGKNWDAIAELVPSRTKRQCMDRWHKCKSGTAACAEN
jgi:hypothetical protein